MPVVCRRPRLGAVSVLRASLCTAAGALAVMAVGCGGNNDLQNGTPVVTVSATNTRFTNFIVNIDSLTLTRDDGNVFTELGTPERADLTKVTDINELLNAPAIPNGTYKTGTLVVDFTGAVINVDVNGQSVAATPVDATGAAVTSFSLTLNFDKNKPLVVNSHQSVRFGLDFNLAASTIVNNTGSGITVIVAPFVVASVVLPNPNPIHVHGAYLISDQKNGSFILNSRPFSDQVNSLGAINVVTDSNTIYDINGQTYTGAAGLTAVGALPMNAGIVAVGTFTDLSKVTPVLTATQVYAGTSLEALTVDHLSGEVLSRSGNVIDVHDAVLTDRTGLFSFINDATLTIGSATIVNTDGSAVSGQSNLAISIGQHIDASGQATLNPTTGAISLDASAGEVRLQPTRVWGLLNSAAPGNLALNLTAIGQFEPAAFNFAGTGVTPASDAVPANYVINTGATDLTATPAATQVRVDGLVTPFASAPPDFTASAVTTAPALDSVLQIEWPNGGSTAPFTSIGAGGIVVNLASTNIGTIHEIDTGPFTQDLTLLSASPLIVPATANATNFSVGGGTGLIINSFTTYSDFVTAVGTNLNGTTAIRKLVALGRYDAGTNTFTATRIDLVDQ